LDGTYQLLVYADNINMLVENKQNRDHISLCRC